ncbi:LysR substrate-binding domain-containing protein [Roseobacter sinensis]|uniref:LysR substrate-binding domain-containing protein n=1 Tax=Roseobacter sinensis TaxID=2931391 RepID=A0ABT3BF34_9RHOB|nr:LysR substrate-binding domain-containing protein [Roseobacter sp. WL0113]MCV3271793.1 LysR substrate-binding domain-containing protein [Roseobacter sp. WL0113]
MSRQLPPLNALRAFEAAGRHESFSRAAEELGVSHSAISRHVRGLEDRLNTRLFREASRGVELTRDGAAYLARVTPALDTIAEATDRVTERPAGVVVVTCEPLLAAKWLVPRLSDFMAQQPDIDIRLEASDSLVDVNRYEADVAIRFLSVAGSDPDALLVSDAPLYPFAAPGLVRDDRLEPAALDQYKLLRDRARDTWAIWSACAGVAPDVIRPMAAWRLRAPLAHAATLAGQGVLLTSQEIVFDDVAAGRLLQVSDVGFRDGGYYTLLGENARRRRPVRLFRDWLLETSGVHRGQLI